MDKTAALLELQERIVAAERALGQEAWFFPEYAGVKGYLGTAEVFFVGPNPSTGRFPQKSDIFLYDHLRAFGFADAHLSDCIKYHLSNNEVQALKKADALKSDGALLRSQRNYFLREVEIIRPRLVVAMGDLAHEILEGWLQGGPRLLKMIHYKKPVRFKQEPDRIQFLKDLRQMQEAFDGPPPSPGGRQPS